MTRRAVTTLALALTAMLPACNIAAPAYFAIVGPPKIPAVTTLPSGRPTVVLIDDPSSKVPRRDLRLLIGKTADDDLLRSKAVAAGKLISSRSAMSASGSGASARPLSIVDIGRRVGAEVVIYAEVTDWSLVSNGESISPVGVLGVRIYDTLKNERIFPEEGAHILVSRLPEETSYRPGDRAAIEKALAARLGLDLSRLFYEHPRDPLQNRRPGSIAGGG